MVSTLLLCWVLFSTNSMMKAASSLPVKYSFQRSQNAYYCTAGLDTSSFLYWTTSVNVACMFTRLQAFAYTTWYLTTKIVVGFTSLTVHIRRILTKDTYYSPFYELYLFVQNKIDLLYAHSLFEGIDSWINSVSIVCIEYDMYCFKQE